MLIQTEHQLEQLLTEFKTSDTVFIDTEGLGLNLWAGETAIGISAYFPDTDNSYYLAWGHGTGRIADDSRTPSELAAAGVGKTTKPFKLANTQAAYEQSDTRQQALAENAPQAWVERLKDVWTLPQTHVYHNALFDLTSLHILGFPDPQQVKDTQVMIHTLLPVTRKVSFRMPDTGKRERGSLSLKWLGRLVGYPNALEGEADLKREIDALNNELKSIPIIVEGKELKSRQKLTSKAHMWTLPPSKVAHYAELDVRLTHAVYEFAQRKLKAWDAVQISDSRNDTQYQALWRMHKTGFKLDVDGAKKMLAQADPELEKLDERAKELVGHEINLGSPTQIVDYLNACGLNVSSSNKEVIDKYGGDFAILPMVGKYRLLRKLSNDYIAKWLEAVAAQPDDIIRPGYNTTGTNTGRLSSSSAYVGNMQNIPRGAVMGIHPKNLLLPPRKGWQLVEMDYSRLEVRIAAHILENLAGLDPNYTLTKIEEHDLDMHAYTRDRARIAELMLSRWGGKVTPKAVDQYFEHFLIEMPTKYDGTRVEYFVNVIARHVAKTVNFLCMYGGGGGAVERQIGFTRAEGDLIVQRWRNTYPAVRDGLYMLQGMALESKQHPGPNVNAIVHYLKYPDVGFGRFMQRYEHYETYRRDKDGKAYNPRSSAAYKAFNAVVQGTAGLITVESAKRIASAFSDDELLLSATVHDSVIVAVPEGNLDTVRECKRLMENWDVKPRLSVDVEMAPVDAAWGYKKEIKI